LIILWARQNKVWSWKLFGWVMLMAVVLGGGAIWGGIALGQMIGPSNSGLTATLMLVFIVVAVIIITIITIALSRRYRPPNAIK
jgi:magnesium-transporting ATPase (P-type)